MAPRKPYVRRGQVVDYIGLERGTHTQSFIGGKIVMKVGEWCPNWQGYLVWLCENGIIIGEHYLDTNLCCFHEEVDPGFWRLPISRGFKNLHEFVRWRRKVDTDVYTSCVLKQYGRLAS
jgi:hypothetical protein